MAERRRRSCRSGLVHLQPRGPLLAATHDSRLSSSQPSGSSMPCAAARLAAAAAAAVSSATDPNDALPTEQKDDEKSSSWSASTWHQIRAKRDCASAAVAPCRGNGGNEADADANVASAGAGSSAAWTKSSSSTHPARTLAVHSAAGRSIQHLPQPPLVAAIATPCPCSKWCTESSALRAHVGSPHV